MVTTTDRGSTFCRRLPGPRAWAVVMLLPGLGMGLGVTVLGFSGADARTLVVAAVLAAALAGLIARHAFGRGVAFGWANRVTLTRAGLVAVLAAVLIEPAIYRDHGWSVAGLALLVLALDGVDGWLARRLHECSEFGARFDMEVDAALILVLCLGLMAAQVAAAWVLLIGLMRYGFVIAAFVWPWLRAPLPPRLRRKLVCVWQVVALLLALTPAVGSMPATGLLLSALVGLGLSFAVDVAWLKRHHASVCSALESQ